jgi:hypothetical protein
MHKCTPSAALDHASTLIKPSPLPTPHRMGAARNRISSGCSFLAPSTLSQAHTLPLSPDAQTVRHLDSTSNQPARPLTLTTERIFRPDLSTQAPHTFTAPALHGDAAESRERPSRRSPSSRTPPARPRTLPVDPAASYAPVEPLTPHGGTRDTSALPDLAQPGGRCVEGFPFVSELPSATPPEVPLLVYTGNRRPNGPDDTKNEGAPAQTPNRFSRLKWTLQDTARTLLPAERNLNKCYRATFGDTVEVWRSPSRSSASYRRLCTCKSVWQCPVCSARIAATRAAEVTAAIQTHRLTGGTCVLATFTASHTRDQALLELNQAHARSHLSFWQHRSVKEALALAGYSGRITAQEVTFGNQTGWHPHRHALLFIDASADLERLTAALAHAWHSITNRHGLKTTLKAGFDLRGGESAGAYVSKLGLEVALACRKIGRTQHRFGPWQMLHLASQKTHWAAQRFIEYTASCRGSRHLVWSPGLKARLGITDTTDAEIMESPAEQDERLYATLSRTLWKAVHLAGLRADLLESIGVDEPAELKALLAEAGIALTGLTILESSI